MTVASKDTDLVLRRTARSSVSRLPPTAEATVQTSKLQRYPRASLVGRQPTGGKGSYS
jgi:hypothetical protein